MHNHFAIALSVAFSLFNEREGMRAIKKKEEKDV